MTAQRQVHGLVQGTPEWHAFRRVHFGASEAAAMLGLSKHTTRSELLRLYALGDERAFSEWEQTHLLDRGHELEARARPLVEAIIADELYPATYSLGKLSASCDGLTMVGDKAFEHKSWNAALAAAVERGEVPDEHMPQCQQIMLVTGAESVIFTVSDGTPEKLVYTEVCPDRAWMERIFRGWEQFADDVANYQHVERVPEATAAPIKDLPALAIQISGQVVASNLAEWRTVVVERIAAINTTLKTDQDFADADKMVKFLADGEARIDVVKAQAQAQATSIDDVFRALDDIKATMRAKRLELDKLVAARKEAVRGEIRQRGIVALMAHIAALNARLGKPYMPQIQADFSLAMKGKKTVASLNDAVDTLLAQKKIETSEVADRIEMNLKAFATIAVGFETLFADLAQCVVKAPDDFEALVKVRIANHKEAEERRRAAAAIAIAAAQTAPAAIGGATAQTAQGPSAPAGPQVYAMPQPATAPRRPTDAQIVLTLAGAYRVDESTVVAWLRAMDFNALLEGASP